MDLASIIYFDIRAYTCYTLVHSSNYSIEYRIRVNRFNVYLFIYLFLRFIHNFTRN